jgi:hypothetical protein
MQELAQASKHIERWWNTLEPEQRARVFRLIPLRSPEQVAVFSYRSWHELHDWMRNDLRKLYCVPGVLEKFDLFVYFRAQERLGRGQCLHNVKYFVIFDADREALPELGQAYAIGLEELPTTNRKTQYWLIPTEGAYDDEVLLALSSLGLSCADDCASSS